MTDDGQMFFRRTADGRFAGQGMQGLNPRRVEGVIFDGEVPRGATLYVPLVQAQAGPSFDDSYEYEQPYEYEQTYQPQYPQPQYAPQYAQPQYGQPQYAQPQAAGQYEEYDQAGQYEEYVEYEDAAYDETVYAQDDYAEGAYDEGVYEEVAHGEGAYEEYGQNGYEQTGYDQNGYDQNGYEPDGYDRNGYAEPARPHLYVVSSLPQQLQPSRQAPEAPAVPDRPRSIAFYQPQFHPTAENDQRWGPGHTEWTSTALAQKLFRGHRQPHLPADLGFYDLRLAETRDAQATLAQQYGVDAFLYRHYWFGDGKRIFERPFAEVLAEGGPDHGFSLAWDNQTWTGARHGADDRVLIEQTYPGGSDEWRHFDSLLPAFLDPRHVRVDGRPLFYVSRPEQLPDPAAWVQRWQAMARSAGLPGLYLVAEVSDPLGRGPLYTQVAEHGFDSGVYVRLPAETGRLARLRTRTRRTLRRQPQRLRQSSRLQAPPAQFAPVLHPCVFPNWDDTPRAGRRGTVLEGSTPERYQWQVEQAAEVARTRASDEQLVFVKSWNEWADGNYLEPDLDAGHGYLRAHAAGLGIQF